MLYIGVGDHGWIRPQNPQRPQDLTVLPGKILRIDPRGGAPYAIPPHNPLAATPGVRPDIWAYGLRNPWRFSFDRGSGALVVGDVGEKAVEEVGLVTRAANMGWPCLEGSRPLVDDRYQPCEAPGAVGPVLERPFGRACSMIGG